MQLNYQQCWCFALSGGQPYAPEIITQPDVLRRTLCRVGGQFIVLAFVLLDVGGLGFALVAPVWLAPWVVINVTVLVLGSLSWSEDRRIQKESATATRRQGAKVRVAEWCKLEELQREAQRQQQEAERRQRQEAEEREAQKRLQAALRQAQEQLKEAEQRRCQEEQRARDAETERAGRTSTSSAATTKRSGAKTTATSRGRTRGTTKTPTRA